MLRYFPASIRRAFSLMWGGVRARFADTPFVFFAIVIGVALTFKFTIGALRDASVTPDVAPTFVSFSPDPAVSAGGPASASAPTADSASAASSTSTPAIGEVGAAAKVQPLGAPARVSPKPRGHGRRLPH